MSASDTVATPATPAPGPVPLDLLIVTGLSGAGRTTAGDCLEDLGWYVVDNIPPALLPRLADLGGRTNGAVSRMAAVVDARSGSFFSDLRSAMEQLTVAIGRPRVLFLEASDDVLVRRFESVRRPHPLQGDRRILDGIADERALLADLRGEADMVIDTSGLNVHQLTDKIARAVQVEGSTPRPRLTVMSFGYKYGLPVDADLVVDCRFLPNPHWVPELRPHTGRDPQVSAYVLGQPGAEPFLDGYGKVLDVVMDGYRREGKRYAMLAIGCTGGKHRSVAIAEELGARLSHRGADVTVVHRDAGRE